MSEDRDIKRVEGKIAGKISKFFGKSDDDKTALKVISIFAVAIVIGFLIGKSLCLEQDVVQTAETTPSSNHSNEIVELPSFTIHREGNAGEINEEDCYDEIRETFGYEKAEAICGLDFVSAKKCSGEVAAGCVDYARCLCYYVGDIERSIYRTEY